MLTMVDTIVSIIIKKIVQTRPYNSRNSSHIIGFQNIATDEAVYCYYVLSWSM